jgi:hypothetical protein
MIKMLTFESNHLLKENKTFKQIIVLITFLFLINNVIAQNNYPSDSTDISMPKCLQKNISINYDGIPLKNVLIEFVERTKCYLNYNENIIPKSHKVFVKLHDVSAAIALQNILYNSGINFVITHGGQIVLVKNKVAPQKYTISGFISDVESGEALVGTNVYMENTQVGCISNVYGFYSLTLPAGYYKLVYSNMGYKIKKIPFELNKNILKNVELLTNILAGDTIQVVSNTEDNLLKSTEIGSIKLSPKELSKTPVIFGEQDILKTIQLLPGITLSREGDSGFHVRGGNSDQNLVLLDEAQVYNAFHFFGFFSVFNSDAIKDLKIFKGPYPSKYGGKLSSVLDIQMKEGNLKKFAGNGGVGLIFSRLTLEGPIVPNKSSFIVSARRTYADLFTGLASAEYAKKSSLYFYDFNLKTNFWLTQKNRLYLSGYFGRDVLGFSEIFRNSWGNETATIRWNHLFNDKLFSNTSLIFSNFSYAMKVEPEENTNDGAVKIENQINAVTIKEDFQYFYDTYNTFEFGGQYVFYNFLPGKISENGRYAWKVQIGERIAREGSIYFNHELKVLDRLKLNYGLRYSNFFVKRFGDSYNFIDTEDIPVVDFGRKENASYGGLEPRITANLEWDEISSFKIGYARNYQNIHSTSNSTSGTPLDIWQPSSSRLKPQRADQISLGYYRSLGNKEYELSFEWFYKDMQNQVDFKNGANIYFSTLMESELVFGTGSSYGIEFLLKKKLGNLTGWLGYSIAKAERKFDEINRGKPFPPKHDRTHDLSIVSMYKFNYKWTLAANWIYYTGNAVTIPYGKYQVNGKIIYAYTERNAFRMPAYHRLDLSLTYTTQNGHNWNLSLYNAYGRKNAYTILFRNDDRKPLKLSLFSFLPSLSYNFKF